MLGHEDWQMLTNISEKFAAFIFNSFTLRLEAAGSSEMLITIYQTTEDHMPEDSNCHSHCSENPKSHGRLCVNVSSCPLSIRLDNMTLPCSSVI
jgi:hypothetical protein